MDNYSQKKCGFCGENIPREAGRCPYCGSILEVTVDQPYGMTEPQQGVTNGFNVVNGANDATASGAGQPPAQESTLGAPNNQSDNQPAEEQNNSYGQQYGSAPQQGMGQRPEYGQRPDYGQRPEYGQSSNYSQRPYSPRNQQGPIRQNSSGKPPLSNGLKVFLTMLFTLVPGIGQLAGIITAIVFMSSNGDDDRRSFGVALLVASLVMFVLSCLSCFLFSMLAESLPF